MRWLRRVALAEALAIAGLAAWLVLRPREDLALSAQPLPGAVTDATAATGGARREGAGDRGGPGSAAPASAPGAAAEVAEILLFGRVTDPTGKPVPGGIVRATRSEESRTRTSEIAPSGDYAFAGLRGGRWELSGKTEGFRPFTRSVTLPRLPAEQSLDLVMEPAVVLKVWFVTPDGKRVQNELREAKLDWRAEVMAFASETPPNGHLMPSRSSRLWARGLGTWRGQDPTRRGQVVNPATPDGTYELDGAVPIHLSAVLRSCVLATQRVEAGQTEVRFTIGLDVVRALLATLKLRLTDAQTGAPLADALIDVSDQQGGGGVGKTGADGGFEKDHMTPGLFSISTQVKDHESLRFWFRLRPGETTDLGSFALGNGLQVTGTVVGPDDKPMAARVCWLDLERAPFPQAVEQNFHSTADGDGKFTLWRLGRSRYMVVATAKDLAPAAVLADLRTGEVPQLRLQLQRGTRVTLDKHLTMEDEFEYLVKDGEGRIPCSGQLVQRGPTTFLLAPGSYLLELHGEQGLRHAVPFVVASAPVTVRVQR